MAESTEHAAAWELATDSWNENDTGRAQTALPRRPIPGGRASTSNRVFRVAAAVAAALLVFASLGIHFWDKSSVTTSLGEQRTLNLPDGTRVELNTNSRVLVQFDDHIRAVVLKSGEAYFNVAHEKRPFVVLAGDHKVIAVGTTFLVRREVGADSAVTVTLIEGRVAIASTGAANVLSPEPAAEVAVLSAGKRWKAKQHSPPTIDTPSIDKETAWMRGQVIFDETPLLEAAKDFNRYNTLQIKVASREAAKIPVGGVFRTGDPVSFAAAVAAAHDLRLAIRDREIVLDSPQEDQPSRQP